MRKRLSAAALLCVPLVIAFAEPAMVTLLAAANFALARSSTRGSRHWTGVLFVVSPPR